MFLYRLYVFRPLDPKPYTTLASHKLVTGDLQRSHSSSVRHPKLRLGNGVSGVGRVWGLRFGARGGLVFCLRLKSLGFQALEFEASGSRFRVCEMTEHGVRKHQRKKATRAQQW